MVDNGRGTFRNASGFFDKLREVKKLNKLSQLLFEHDWRSILKSPIAKISKHGA